MTEYSIGVDLGGTNLRAAAVSGEGEILEKLSGTTDLHEGRDAVIADMVKSINRLKAKCSGGTLAGVGIGVPGFILMKEGVIVGSNNLPQFDGYPVRDEIEKRLGTRIFLENDANAAALGEKWIGAGREVDDLVLLTLGTGIGGGIIAGGRVLHGYLGMAGELGHMTVVPSGNPCGCGNYGCLEKHASATAIVNMARMLSLGDDLTSEDVYDLAVKGNDRAKMIFNTMGTTLGIAIANLINIFNFPMYLLSGGVLAGWDQFAPAMMTEIEKRSFTYRNTKTRVQKATLGNQAGLFGAAYLLTGETVRETHMYWLGIDIGTGGSRALLINEIGAVKATFTAAHEDMLMERPLWAEQRPQNWWDAVQKAVRGVLAESGVAGKDVRGIGLSGQMHGSVLLDSKSEVVRPALIWCDQRSQAQVDFVHSKVGMQKVLQYTANPVVTAWTLPKLLWVRDHEPRNFERVRKVLLPKDYVRFQLTREFASEVSDASGTALFDVVQRRWSYEMCEALDLNTEILPAVYESQEVSGKVTPEMAALLGLEPGTPVVGGGGDQATSAVGNGIVESGIVSCTLGTSGVVFAHMDEPYYDPQGRVHTFCHAVKNKWHVMGVTQGAGLSLQWFRNVLAPGVEYSELMKEAGRAARGSQGLFWLPYLMGERTPHLDATARAAWVGLTARHTRAEMIRAVIEGVCYSQKDGLDIIEAMGVPMKSVRISGGGAQSGFWRQLMTDILNKPVVTLATQEGSAYGAAVLATVGTGAYSNVEEACRGMIRETDHLVPQEDEAQAYSQLHQTYQSIYPALKPIFGKL